MKRCISGIIMGLVVALAGGEAAAVPNTFTFTGRLQNNGSPVDGAVSLGFALYDAASGGTQLWTETHSTTADNGLVSAAVGGQAALDPADFDGSNRWIEVSVNGQALAPRYQIRSVPYALRAAVADSADSFGGLDPGDVALATHNHDTAYAALGHNHDSAYAALSHNHNSQYAAIGHNHDTAYYTQATLNGAGTINTGTNPVDWTKLKGVPAGIADGADADSGGDITGVTASTGLSGGGSAGAVSLSVSFGGTGAATTVARSDHNHNTTYVEGNYTVLTGYVSCGGGGCGSGTVAYSAAFVSAPQVLLTPERNGNASYCQVITGSASSFTYSCAGAATYMNWLAIR